MSRKDMFCRRWEKIAYRLLHQLFGKAAPVAEQQISAQNVHFGNMKRL